MAARDLRRATWSPALPATGSTTTRAAHLRGRLDRRLLINRCAACGRWHHPPHPICPHCWSTEVSAQPVAGTGTIHLAVFLHQGPPATGVDYATPYPVVTVDLDEQPGLRFTATVVGLDAGRRSRSAAGSASTGSSATTCRCPCSGSRQAHDQLAESLAGHGRHRRRGDDRLRRGEHRPQPGVPRRGGVRRGTARERPRRRPTSTASVARHRPRPTCRPCSASPRSPGSPIR